LYRTRGGYLKDLPDQVHILEQAARFPHSSRMARVKKILVSSIKGYLVRALFNQIRYKKKIGFNEQTMAYCQAFLSRKLDTHYDVAIGYLELWADAFVLNRVKADKKIIWVHVDYGNSHYVPDIDIKEFQKADAIVTVSRECQMNFMETFPSQADKTVFLENIISPTYILSKSKEEIHDFEEEFHGLKIITVCRLDIFTKGLDRGVSAMKQLCDEGYDVRWYLVGKGRDVEMGELIRAEGLEGKMILLGEKLNPYPYYAKCDIYVLPSRIEGKPVSVTEAQILGLPVVTTGYSSSHEQVINEVDGIIVRNDDESIYHGIKRILDEPALIEKFKDNIKKRRFSNEDQIEEFYKLIE